MCWREPPPRGPPAPRPAGSAPPRSGNPLPPRKTEPPVPPPARGSATRSSQASAEVPAKSNSRSCSSASPLVLVQKTAQLIQLFLRRSPARHRVDHQLASRAFEHPLQDVADDLPLSFLL